MKRLIIIAAALLSFCIAGLAQDQKQINQQIFDKVYASVKSKADLPTGQLALEIAKQFEGTDYVSYTLEVEPEALQVFLNKTDCILFVELCTSFALTVKGKKIVQGAFPKRAKPSYELLCYNIQQMRYREGVIDGYASRIHYTSEWLIQGRKNHVLYEYTSELGKEFEQTFSFMTDHPDVYRQLKNDPAAVRRVREAEQWLETQKPYWKISQEDLMKEEVISKIQDGDIITFIDTHKGLDLAHVAMACTGTDGKMHFIHASMRAGKVIIEPKALAEYATNGIRVSRLYPMSRKAKYDNTTSSVARLNVKEEDAIQYATIYDYIRARVPGLTVLSGNELRIRGASSLNSDTEPLILVNGVEMADISCINPNDVKSIEVVKDGTASMYGAKAAYGVVIIKLK